MCTKFGKDTHWWEDTENNDDLGPSHSVSLRLTVEILCSLLTAENLAAIMIKKTDISHQQKFSTASK